MPIKKFEPGHYFMYDDERGVITYMDPQVRTKAGKSKLLHEIAHAILGHTSRDDAGRYAMERDAWGLAREMGHLLNVDFQESVVRASLKQTEADGYAPI